MYQKIILISFSLLVTTLAEAQVLSLPEAISLAAEQSLRTQNGQLALEEVQRENDLLKKALLPTISLSTTAPVFSKTTSRITVPSGEDVFVNQNQLFTDFSLGMTVADPIFNGEIEITSSMNRLNILGDQTASSYYSVPIAISYRNDNLLYNEYKWQSRVAELDLGIERRKLEQTRNEVAVEVTDLFFEQLIASGEAGNYRRQERELRQLLTLAKERLQLGAVERSEVLSLELELLELASDLEQRELDYSVQHRELAQLLGTSAFELDTALVQLIPVRLPVELEQPVSYTNTNDYLELERERLLIDQDLAKTKTEDLFSVSVNGSFGLSNTGTAFSESISDLVDQQRYSVSVNWTIFDFGKRQDKMHILELKEQRLGLDVQEQTTSFEVEVKSLINKTRNNYRKLQILREAQQIAAQNYDNLLERFQLGNVPVQNLIDARAKSRDLYQEYLSTMKTYWLSLYQLQEKTNLYYGAL
ncbi:MAG: TolC family protein [Bacteroidota bacterium]